MELSIRGPLKCLNFMMVNNLHYVKMVQSLENFKQYSGRQYYLLIDLMP